jgi:hypothetical protein
MTTTEPGTSKFSVLTWVEPSDRIWEVRVEEAPKDPPHADPSDEAEGDE